MCTVTVRRRPEDLLLTFNRDEQPKRGVETPPVMRQSEIGNVGILSPMDGSRGGTWIGLNSSGVAACLLNGYHANDIARRGSETAAVSRGEIIPKMLAQGGLDGCMHWLNQTFDPALFNSFTLLVFTLHHAISVRWTGEHPLRSEAMDGEWMMWTSSSWNAAEVLPWRRARFEEWIRKGASFAGDVPALHLLQPDGKEEYSPLMRRDGAATQSITQIQMNATGQMEMRYWPAPVPDLPLPRSRVKMACSVPC